jgi:hypothetical protein
VTERTERDRVESRADAPLPEEQRAGSDDPIAQAAGILADSEARTLDRSAAPGSIVEQRTSEETVEPPAEPDEPSGR